MTAILLTYPNVEIYDFQARTEWILDLNHYIDAKHYGADINAAMAEDIAAGNCRITDGGQVAQNDALLTVTPYYNKASQSGLVQHFSAIADAVDIPVILYNVPSRTGVGCTAQTYQALAKHPNIAGVKEASDDFDLIQDTLNLCPPGFTVWSGNDGSTAAIMALGGKGVISVAANVVPREMHELTQLCLENRFLEAGALQLKLHELIRALFCEVNPIPVKTTMELLGLCSGELRLPLCRISERHLEQLSSALKPFRASV